MPAFSTLSSSLGIEVKARGGMSVRTVRAVMKTTAADGTQSSGGEAQVRICSDVAGRENLRC